MGIFDLFGKKKDSSKPAPKEVPLAKVEEMVGKGLSMRQMVDYLKSEGYSIDLIDKAFSQLKAKQGVSASNAGPVSPPLDQSLPSNLPNPSSGFDDSELNNSSPLPNVDESADLGGSGVEDDISELDELDSSIDSDVSKVGNVESLVEVIIEEKFAELADKIESLDDLKENVSGSIDSFRNDIDSLKKRLDSLEKFKEESLSVQRKALDEFRLEISAMEKAFQKLVPTLSATVRKMRESSAKNKKSSSKSDDNSDSEEQ